MVISSGDNPGGQEHITVNKTVKNSWIVALFILLYVTSSVKSAAETEADTDQTMEQILQGFRSSFQLPLSDLFNSEEGAKPGDGSYGLSGSFRFNFPLQANKKRSTSGRGSQGEPATNLRLTTSVRYTPLRYWFIETSFYYYLNEKAKASWTPEFTYLFGYDDWHPYTLSLVYSNYGGNRLSPNRSKGERFTRIEQGTLSLGWKYKLPRYLEELFIVHESGSLSGNINYNVTPHYNDAVSNQTKHWQQTFSFSLQYTIYKELSGNITFSKLFPLSNTFLISNSTNSLMAGGCILALRSENRLMRFSWMEYLNLLLTQLIINQLIR